MSRQKQARNKRTRYAVYTRYSSDMQNELSLEAQEARCRQAIAERGGVVIQVFSDSAKSGWSLDRDGFNQLRQAAERRKFDAVMFWKFDRLARNHDHAVMIKLLLRQEYNLKLYCVEGFSEDDDDSPYSAMMEQLLAVFSAFYSKNLSNETKRGKYQRAINGEFNGSVPPIGYHLVTKAAATLELPSGLYIVPRIAAIVRRAFRLYATGEYSHQNIAQWMNERAEIQKLRQGKVPVGKEMVRDMLQNRTYLGYVPYAETIYSGSLGEGKSSSRRRKQWFEGKHEGFISDDLFNICQDVRQEARRISHSPAQIRTYVLHDRVYCSRCISSKPTNLIDRNYGKMRPGWDHRRDRGHYRCIARDRGYKECEQGYITSELVNEQVIKALSTLKIPDGFQERVETAIRNKVEHAAALERMSAIEEIVQRIDFSWEQGYLSPQEYIQKRERLQKEIESLKPVDYDALIEAADLLENFSTYWDACEEMNAPLDARKQLLSRIVDKVFVYDDRVVGIALHGDYGVVLDDTTKTPNEVLQGLQGEIKKGAHKLESACTQNGSDGDRTRDLRLDRPAC